jgi:hypothetical protein
VLPLDREELMDQAYWLERERDAIANARAATLADVRLIHYDLAHRYSIEAVNAATAHPVRKKRKLKRNLGEQLTTAFRA